MNRIYFVFLLLPLLLLSACQDSLSGKKWVLTEIVGSGAPLSGKAYLQIHENAQTHVEGSGGCNLFSGKFDVKGDILSVGPLISTRMACPDMREEQAFFGALNHANAYRLEKGKLLLLRGNVPLLRFKASSPSEMLHDNAK